LKFYKHLPPCKGVQKLLGGGGDCGAPSPLVSIVTRKVTQQKVYIGPTSHVKNIDKYARSNPELARPFDEIRRQFNNNFQPTPETICIFISFYARAVFDTYVFSFPSLCCYILHLTLHDCKDDYSNLIHCTEVI
jgi:hypothetical protein